MKYSHKSNQRPPLTVVTLCLKSYIHHFCSNAMIFQFNVFLQYCSLLHFGVLCGLVLLLFLKKLEIKYYICHELLLDII